MYTTRHPLGQPRKQRWPLLSWQIGILLIAIPLLGILLTIVYAFVFDNADIEGRVLDAYSGDPVAGAIVRLGDDQTTTGEDGRFGLRSNDHQTLSISSEGYAPTSHELTGSDNEITIDLRPTTVSGTVLNRLNDTPLAGVLVEATLNGEVVSSSETVQDGSYELRDVPEGAEIVFSYPDFATVVEPVATIAETSVTMRPGLLTGFVTDEAGNPISGATIAIADVSVETGEDGTFRLEEMPEEGEVYFKAPGYHYERLDLDDELEVMVELREKPIRAIYVTANAAGDAERFQELLDLVERTELNAMVIDTKDSSGYIFYDTQVELAHEIGAVRPAYDVEEILEQVKSRGIYAISRQVVFEDPVLAENRPELAIRDSESGELWRTWNGLAWVSAYEEEVWEYNIDLLLEQVELGFDEIQYDYIRFPSDGPLNRAEYNVDEHTSESRSDAVAEFLRRSHDAIKPTPAYLAGDIFGLTLWELGDGGIGQNLEKVTPVLDYVCPMIYPSHFYPGSMGFQEPNDHPYEVILWSLQNGVERVPNHKAKLRPWLQDFSFGPGRAYGSEEVRDQINASNEFGASGWMLWNASSRYHSEALNSD